MIKVEFSEANLCLNYSWKFDLFEDLFDFIIFPYMIWRSQSSKLTDVSHHKGELSFVSKLRLQLMYDLPELGHKICGIIFHSENSNIITYERSRTNSFFAFKVRESDKKEIQLLEPMLG